MFWSHIRFRLSVSCVTDWVSCATGALSKRPGFRPCALEHLPNPIRRSYMMPALVQVIVILLLCRRQPEGWACEFGRYHRSEWVVDRKDHPCPAAKAGTDFAGCGRGRRHFDWLSQSHRTRQGGADTHHAR